MKKSVLKDIEADKLLREIGYTVVNFISAEQVDELANFYQEYPNDVEQQFHTTHFSSDKDYKTNIQQFVFSVLEENIKKHFVDYIPVFANFMVKEAGGSNPMPIHADWTYVDEDSSSSYAIWIPLVDTDIHNGCIGVIPYSQNLSNNIRGPRILQWEHPVNDILIAKMGKLLPMKKGQALIYNHRTLHYSPPNNSDIVRPAINISLVPEGEPIIHYTIPEGKSDILKFAVDDILFFLDYDNFQTPRHGKIAEIIPASSPLFNNSVPSFIEKHNRKGFFSVLKKFLS
jgi:ectoine hydroxylase-related dioxygenase (phytanoyl-CoA dioxygenase family)